MCCRRSTLHPAQVCGGTTWTGVTCSGSDVVEVHRSGAGLAGPLSPELGELTAMTIMDLNNNALTGTVPPQLSMLASMAHLNLGQNELTGTVPAHLSAMASISYLRLDFNTLVGSIPAEFSTLAALSLSDYRVHNNTHLCGNVTKAPSSTTGTALGSACSSQLLQTVALLAFRDRLVVGKQYITSWNMASGIPVCGGTEWIGVTCEGTNVRYLVKGSSSLAGSLVPEFSALTYMDRLDLRANRLTGTIPALLSTLASLSILYLDRNLLAGTIPAQLSTLASLTLVELNSNALTGSIPPQLSKLTRMATLRLDSNALTGKIPAQLNMMVPLGRL
mmetsp:Transcript_37965/g.119817  ORF Transcript_37965/g.119817 Transcript_37965/m.119817 type:complete len:333 (+) Transcript_37965:465-1463(+)